MARTARLPGVESEINSELSRLAEDYVAHRDVRMAALKEEVEVKLKVIAMMEGLKLKTYHDDEANLTITLETKTKVKVKIHGEEDEDGQ